MPGFVTHYLFGSNAYRLLDLSNTKRIIQQHHNSFSLGLQGPDLFYYNIPMLIGIRPNIGELMHNQKTNVFFKHLIHDALANQDKSEREIAISYIEGFMGHYLLDITIHPYVYSRVGTNKTQKTLGMHFALESDIDNAVLHHFKNCKATDFSHALAIHLTKQERHVIARLLSSAIHKTYGQKLTCKSLNTAMLGFELECNLLTDRNLHKQRIISCIEHIFPGYPILSPLLINEYKYTVDPCNERHKPWRNPWDKDHSSTESIFDVFESCLSRYVEVMVIMERTLHWKNKDRLFDEAKLLTLLGNNSYSSGRECLIY